MQFGMLLGIRTFATLKDVQLRLKSVKNIEKITKSMKMIASTKLARAQKSMDIGKTFADASTRFFAQAATKHGQLNEQDVPSPQLVVVCSSDRGLCGAIHSSLTKEVKKQFLRTGDDEDENLEAQLKIVALGDKVKTQLMRVCRQNLIINVGQISKNVPTFLEALTVVNLINEQLPLQTISNSFIVFNRFISAISYQSTTIPIFSKADILASGTKDF